MAPKKTAAKTTAKTPVKRVYKKRVPKKEVEKVGVVQKVKDWYKGKKWYIIGIGIIILILIIGFLILRPSKVDRIVKKGQKVEQKAAKELQEIERLQRENDSLKAAANAAQEEAEEQADEATKDRKEYEVQSTKKKEQTKVKYNETNKQVKEAVTNVDLDKLDAIRIQQQRARDAARKEMPDSSRIRATDFGTRRRN